MLASLRIPSILLGIGAGALAATLLAVLIEAAVQISTESVEPGAGLVPGIVTGFVVGGYAAGRTSVIAHRFHGAVTGLALTGLIVFIARLGGSPAGVGPVLFLAIVGMVVGGLGGTWAGRRHGRESPTSHSG